MSENSKILLVGLREIAEALGAGEKTVRYWINFKRLPARKGSDGIYRACPDQLLRWFQEH